MAFINWNLVTTAVPTYYTYILQPSIIAPVAIGVPNPQLPILQLNEGVKVVPDNVNPVANSAVVPELPTLQPKTKKTKLEAKRKLPKIAPKVTQDWSLPISHTPAPIKEEPQDEENEDNKNWTTTFKEEINTYEDKTQEWPQISIKEEKIEDDFDSIHVKEENEESDDSEASSSDPLPPQKSSRRDKIFTCDHCAYTTTWRGNLTKHVVSRHTSSDDIQWLQCAHCPYKGKTKDYLKCHLLHVHNISVKWFNCPHCSFKAKLKGHLDRHIIVNHTESEKIQWFSCDHCDYKAKFKINLKQHVLSKHTASKDIKWYECDFCEFKAKRKRNLKFHKLNKHTDLDKIQLFECEFCPYLSKRRQALTGHINAVHGGKNGRGKLKTKEIPVFIENRLCWKRVVVDNAEEDCSFRCSQCMFVTVDKEAFRKHVLREHIITELTEEDNNIVKTKYTTKDVLVFVDNVPCVKKIIERVL